MTPHHHRHDEGPQRPHARHEADGYGRGRARHEGCLRARGQGPGRRRGRRRDGRGAPPPLILDIERVKEEAHRLAGREGLSDRQLADLILMTSAVEKVPATRSATSRASTRAIGLRSHVAARRRSACWGCARERPRTGRAVAPQRRHAEVAVGHHRALPAPPRRRHRRRDRLLLREPAGPARRRGPADESVFVLNVPPSAARTRTPTSTRASTWRSAMSSRTGSAGRTSSTSATRTSNIPAHSSTRTTFHHRGRLHAAEGGPDPVRALRRPQTAPAS